MSRAICRLPSLSWQSVVLLVASSANTDDCGDGSSQSSGESGLPAPALLQLVPQQVQVGAEPELARERLPWDSGAPGGQGPTLSVQPESREVGGKGAARGDLHST